MNMAEVRCQLRQQALHVCPLTIPGDQAVDCEGMPRIMKSRLVTTSVTAQHASADTQPAEDISAVWRATGVPVRVKKRSASNEVG